jgi:hypothetical protein
MELFLIFILIFIPIILGHAMTAHDLDRRKEPVIAPPDWEEEA